MTDDSKPAQLLWDAPDTIARLKASGDEIDRITAGMIEAGVMASAHAFMEAELATDAHDVEDLLEAWITHAAGIAGGVIVATYDENSLSNVAAAMAALFHVHLIRNIAGSLEHDEDSKPADLDAFG